MHFILLGRNSRNHLLVALAVPLRKDGRHFSCTDEWVNIIKLCLCLALFFICMLLCELLRMPPTWSSPICKPFLCFHFQVGREDEGQVIFFQAPSLKSWDHDLSIALVSPSSNSAPSIQGQRAAWILPWSLSYPISTLMQPFNTSSLLLLWHVCCLSVFFAFQICLFPLFYFNLIV